MNQHPSKISRNSRIVLQRTQLGDTWKDIAATHGISITTARRVVDRYHEHVHTRTHSQRFGTPNEART